MLRAPSFNVEICPVVNHFFSSPAVVEAVIQCELVEKIKGNKASSSFVKITLAIPELTPSVEKLLTHHDGRGWSSFQVKVELRPLSG